MAPWTPGAAGALRLEARAVYSGPETAFWDGRNDSGRVLASGVFFARLQVGDAQVTRKITRLR